MKTITEAYLKIINRKPKTSVELTETTVPEKLHHIPESWDHHSMVSEETSEKIRSAMTKGSFTHFPLHDEHSEGDPDVIEHLTNHGYEIKDYKKGIATIKKQVGNPEKGIPYQHKYVDESIGSILNKTNATPDVKTSFVNDPTRSSTKAKMHVVISTSPLALAGMSTGTSWRDQSCMNMEGGALSHKLKDDSEHGTHVAFLVHHDDATAFEHGEPSKPIARIALKPYHDGADTIFRPELKTYGTDTSAFSNAVSRWSNENYPAKVETSYYKNKKVYDDSSNYRYRNMSKDAIEEHIKRDYDFDEGTAIDNHVITHGINFIDSHFADKSPEQKAVAISSFANINNLTTAHVLKLNKISSDPSTSVLRALMRHHGDKASTSMMNEYVSDGTSPSVKMLMNPKLSDEHLDKVSPLDYRFVRRSKLKDHHMTKMIDGIIEKGYFGPSDNAKIHDFKDKLNPDHLIKLARSKDVLGVAKTIISANNFTKDVHNALLNSPNINSDAEYGKRRISGILNETSKFASIEDAHAAPTPTMYSELAKNPHLGSETHKKLKDIFMSQSTGGDPDKRSIRYSSNILGFSYSKVPKNISDHMTTEDFDKLTGHNYEIGFEDKKASNEFLDASERKLKRLDDAVSDADDSNKLSATNKLHYHISNHVENIDHHIGTHVENDNGDSSLDKEEWTKTIHRIVSRDNPRSIHNLKNYHNPSDPSMNDHPFASAAKKHYSKFVYPSLKRLDRMMPS